MRKMERGGRREGRGGTEKKRESNRVESRGMESRRENPKE